MPKALSRDSGPSAHAPERGISPLSFPGAQSSDARHPSTESLPPPNIRSAEEAEPPLPSPSTMSTLISPVSAVSLSKGPFRSGSASQASPALGGRLLKGQT